jgi:hypothetical protein
MTMNTIRGTRTWVVGIMLSCACGDPRDIEVPLPLSGGPAPSAPSTAVVVMQGSGPDEMCDTFQVSLPDIDAARALRIGGGEQLSARDGAQIDCRVQVADQQALDVFDIALRLENEALPYFDLRGRVATGEVAMLTLTTSLTRDGEMQAICSGVPRGIMPGAVWFPLFNCADTRYDETPIDCRIEGGVLFERCDR